MSFLFVVLVFGLAFALVLIPVAISEARDRARGVTPHVYRADMPTPNEEPPSRVSKILANPEGASLKRIAWAYGCAKKDSDEEAVLLRVLLTKIDQTKLGEAS